VEDVQRNWCATDVHIVTSEENCTARFAVNGLPRPTLLADAWWVGLLQFSIDLDAGLPGCDFFVTCWGISRCTSCVRGGFLTGEYRLAHAVFGFVVIRSGGVGEE
jgi:hypothetical protein